jgi:hypothetical protein
MVLYWLRPNTLGGRTGTHGSTSDVPKAQLAIVW